MQRKQRITTILTGKLNPTHIEVENESHKHHVPEGSETHFKISVVSTVFLSLSMIARHRLVNNLLADELNNGLHALSMHLFTPEEWEGRQQGTPPSPACKDGFRHG